ncbi:hypothetical protein [Lactiplantibacillus plantarum]|uniref:hypothetical protein n=1 Tax=Lactiplantibacillus plantarum TaxID=1590 RepID=UPI000977B163|nr:hypothetical protein [Lactiplantibacillus plantarum]
MDTKLSNKLDDELSRLMDGIEFAVGAVNEGGQVTKNGKPVATSTIAKEASENFARVAEILAIFEQSEEV